MWRQSLDSAPTGFQDGSAWTPSPRPSAKALLPNKVPILRLQGGLSAGGSLFTHHTWSRRAPCVRSGSMDGDRGHTTKKTALLRQLQAAPDTCLLTDEKGELQGSERWGRCRRPSQGLSLMASGQKGNCKGIPAAGCFVCTVPALRFHTAPPVRCPTAQGTLPYDTAADPLGSARGC